MKNVDQHCTDLPDCILKCAAQIWEGNSLVVQWQARGLGRFVQPSGVDVFIWGRVSHVEFGPWGLRREITLMKLRSGSKYCCKQKNKNDSFLFLIYYLYLQ